MKDFEECKDEIEMFDMTRRKSKKEMEKEIKEEQLERALYNWLNKTEELETAICKLLDGEIKKKDLKTLKLNLEIKYKVLEDLIELY